MVIQVAVSARPEYGICEVFRGAYVTGLGFAIGPSHVVTCAHVVNSALGRAGKRDPARPGQAEVIRVRFAIGSTVGDDGYRAASVMRWLPDEAGTFDANDIAVLQLAEPAPAHVCFLRPAGFRPLMPVQMWGPQGTGRPDGGHVKGELLGEVRGGRIQISVGGGPFRVRPGFSGGPVWEPATGDVAGVLSACGAEDDATDAYLLGTDRVAMAWPDWRQGQAEAGPSSFPPPPAGPPPHVTPAPPPPRRSRKKLIWGLITLAVSVAAIIGVVLSESGASRPPAANTLPAVTPAGSAVASQSASAPAVTPAGSAVASQSASAPATLTRTFQTVVTSGSATATSCQPKQQSEQAFVTTTPPAAPTREGDILVYPDSKGSSPVGITKGPDGAMWYANASASYSIGRITASGTITHYNAAAGLVRPFGIVAGPDGALWFTGSGSIGRLTTAGGATPFTFFTGTCIGSADWIAAGPDGALWFTTGLAGAGAIGRITTSGMLTTYRDPSIDEAAGITAGPDGALWFVNSASRANPAAGSIGRITTAGAVGNYALPGITHLSGITAGPGGTLWFTGIDPQQAESVYKMTTSGAVTEYVNPGFGQVGGSYLGNGGGIVQGPDSAMWFTDYGGSQFAIIGRLSAATGAFTPYDTPGLVIAANEIASGPGNALWFTMGARGIGRLPAPR